MAPSEPEPVAEWTKPSWEEARTIVERARDEGLVICFGLRIGALPFFMHTPYENNRGVMVHMWSCVSRRYKAMPGRTIISREDRVWPDEEDYWPCRIITTERMVYEVAHAYKPELFDPAETPFAGLTTDWTE